MKKTRSTLVARLKSSAFPLDKFSIANVGHREDLLIQLARIWLIHATKIINEGVAADIATTRYWDLLTSEFLEELLRGALRSDGRTFRKLASFVDHYSGESPADQLRLQILMAPEGMTLNELGQDLAGAGYQIEPRALRRIAKQMGYALKTSPRGRPRKKMSNSKSPLRPLAVLLDWDKKGKIAGDETKIANSRKGRPGRALDGGRANLGRSRQKVAGRH